MSEYLVELYLPPSEFDAMAALWMDDEGREAADGAEPVHFLRSVFVPGDEVCYCLFAASSADAVRDLMQVAGVEFERITPAVSVVDTFNGPATGSREATDCG